MLCGVVVVLGEHAKPLQYGDGRGYEAAGRHADPLRQETLYTLVPAMSLGGGGLG